MENRNCYKSIVVFLIMLMVLLVSIVYSFELHDIKNNTPAAFLSMIPLLLYGISASAWLLYEQWKVKVHKSMNVQLLLLVVGFQLMNIFWIFSIRN